MARSASRRGRPALRLFGVHAVAAALANPARRTHRLLLDSDSAQELLARLTPAEGALPPMSRLSRRELTALVPEGAVHQGVVLEADPLPGHALEDLRGPGCVVALDQVTDPHNVGAILRSAAAFGALGVLITDRHAPAETGTLARAASGGLDLVPLVRVANLVRALESLKSDGFWIYGLADEAGEALGSVAVPESRVLVLGAEGPGLRRLTREACDGLVCLPTDPRMPSLNVSNAAAVALYALRPRDGAAAPVLKGEPA